MVAEIRSGVKSTTDGLRRARALNALRQRHPLTATDNGSLSLLARNAREGAKNSTWSPTDSDERLLNEYFDRVFPLQFPFYVASVPERGHGWLRSLMRRCEPLCYAALALAIVYRNSSSDRVDVLHGPSREHEQQQLYALAVTGLRQHIDRLSKKSLQEGLRGGIEVFACVTYLIMLEDDDEQVEAAAKEASSIDSSLSLVDHVAMEFFSAVFLWLDTLATVSTGRRPRFADVCAAAFGAPDCKVRLRSIMGCENWVMIVIRDIAVLDGLVRDEQGGHPHPRRGEGVRRKYIELKDRLQLGLAEPWESYLSLLARGTKDSAAAEHRLIQATPIVTHIFACAAMVYLTVVVSGRPDPHNPEIRDAVSRSIRIFRALPDDIHVQMLHGMLWPFCITGCMALKDQESSFEYLALKAAGTTVVHQGPDTLWRALQVMRTCWRIRSGQSLEGVPSVDWFSAMSTLGYQVLLV
ncbi:hypothetical protein AYL99_02933 [Fonsecaea erecta]|uniref:Uncharacterized protein n=1 Tax=Fonsecaea erecta TaxID=1367422 RepID=A0A178ZWE0_9EURO|nr:hypothetical protein AYL99_02933 [Fonsecaea erecta]OAP63706.1 hypothetical protein AYL99_02933 [Fonsecaea erecta]